MAAISTLEPPSCSKVVSARLKPLQLQTGACPIPGYELREYLGRGEFGEVWSANGPLGTKCALKFLLRGNSGSELERTALELMRAVRHPHLLEIRNLFESPDYFILETEVADGTLHDELTDQGKLGKTGIPLDKLMPWMHQAAAAIDFLNERRHHKPDDDRAFSIVHGDIKPKNLMLVQGKVKVADYGLVAMLDQSVVEGCTGFTLAYASPEVLQSISSRWADQFSLAVTYYHLRTGELPYAGNGPQIVVARVQGKAPILNRIPPTEADVLLRAMNNDPRCRWPSCLELINALETAQTQAVESPSPAGEIQNVPPWLATDHSLARRSTRNWPRPSSLLAALAAGVLTGVAIIQWLVPKTASTIPIWVGGGGCAIIATALWLIDFARRGLRTRSAFPHHNEPIAGATTPWNEPDEASSRIGGATNLAMRKAAIALFEVARNHQRNGEFEEGLRAVGMAIQMDPTIGNLYDLRADLWTAVGNLDRALEDRNEARRHPVIGTSDLARA